MSYIGFDPLQIIKNWIMNREIIQGHWLAWQSKLNISLSARSQGDMLFSSPCLCDSVHKKSFRQSVMTPKLNLIAFSQLCRWENGSEFGIINIIWKEGSGGRGGGEDSVDNVLK